MLVLQRAIGETVAIGLKQLIEVAVEAAGPMGEIVRASMLKSLEGQTEIIVTLVEVRSGKSAKIGVAGPRVISVHRGEIQARVNEEYEQRKGSQ